MKATLASIACLLVAGFLAAASVDGNNKAVVIQKDVVKSGTGWQFICVPVNALNINGSTTGTIKLSTFLPPTTVTSGTIVYRKDETGFKSAATLENGEWSTDPKLNPGETLWISDSTGDTEMTPGASSRAEAGTGTTPQITFCGQERTRTATTRPTTAGVSVMQNDGATPIALSAIVSDPQKNDVIMVLAKDKNEYIRYRRISTGWVDNEWNDASTKTIAPGEAFYYFSAPAN